MADGGGLTGTLVLDDQEPTPADVAAVTAALGAGTFFWLDLDVGATDATTAYDLLRDDFGLHPLALEDAEHFGQRPKFDDYDDYDYVVVHGADPGGIGTLEVHLFVSATFVVTIHRGPCVPMQAVQERLARRRAAGSRAAPQILVLYLVVDALTDSFFPVLSGLDDVPGVTVNRYCSSSLQTIRMAAHAIRAGEGDVFVAAGVETVSRYKNGAADIGPHNPLFADAEARTKARAPKVTEPWQPTQGLHDIYIAMGQTAENVAELKKVSREEQDEFALLSQTRAVASMQNGFFEREIIPVTTPDGTVVTKDDGPRPNTTMEGLAQLQPVFREGGTVTAGNACPLNDGAAAVVVMSDTRAAELGVKPLARIVASGVTALNPEIMGLGPVDAVRQTLKRAGMTIDDVDLVEINEAFAAQVVPSARELGIDHDKLNVPGWALPPGPPLGQTRARLTPTPLHARTGRGESQAPAPRGVRGRRAGPGSRRPPGPAPARFARSPSRADGCSPGSGRVAESVALAAHPSALSRTGRGPCG